MIEASKDCSESAGEREAAEAAAVRLKQFDPHWNIGTDSGHNRKYKQAPPASNQKAILQIWQPIRSAAERGAQSDWVQRQ